MDYIEKNLQLPTEELLTAQKAFAKININRSKENADALMNSNDKLLEKIVSFERTLQNNNEKIIRRSESEYGTASAGSDFKTAGVEFFHKRIRIEYEK